MLSHVAELRVRMHWDIYMLCINDFAVYHADFILIRFRLQETNEIPISSLFYWCRCCCLVPFCGGLLGGESCVIAQNGGAPFSSYVMLPSICMSSVPCMACSL